MGRDGHNAGKIRFDAEEAGYLNAEVNKVIEK